jgi:hypothetical protein
LRLRAQSPHRSRAAVIQMYRPLKTALQHVAIIVIVFDVEHFGRHVADFPS